MHTPVNLMIFIISIICYLLAGLIFLILYKKLNLPNRWIYYFYILLFFSFFQSLLVICYHKSKYCLLFISLNILLINSIGIPFGKYLVIEFILLPILIIEIVIYLKHPVNKIFISISIILSLILQQPFNVWNIKIKTPLLYEIVLLGVFLFGIFFIFNLIKKSMSEISNLKAISDRLQNAVLQLTNANVGFQQYANIVEEKSVKEERKRITREIHDTIGYTLTNIIMMTENTFDLIPKNRYKLNNLLKNMHEQAQIGFEETRRALRELRSIEVPILNGIQVIKRIVDAFQIATGVEVNINYGNVTMTYSDNINEFIYHMIQECMANAFRHGRATEIRIHLFQSEKEIILNVNDNGSASGEIVEGIGLCGIKERIEKMNGKLKYGIALNGFQISARIPL